MFRYQYIHYLTNSPHAKNNDGVIITIISIFVAWFIYRLGVWNQRRKILDSISEEISLHSYWLSAEYTTMKTYDPTWKLPSYVVFKLSTVAIDNAISNGTDIFLNKSLIKVLVGYRQKVNQFNQLVDAAMSFQSNVELWKKPSKKILNRMHELTCQIHWYGIGNHSQDLGHSNYIKVSEELERENNLSFRLYFWLITNIKIN